MKVQIVIWSNQLTKEELQVLLQAIRDAEQRAFKEKEIQIFVSAPELKIEEMEEILRSVKPGFAMIQTFPTIP